MQKTYLKLQDTTVLEFNTQEGYFNVLEPALLPYILKDRVVSSQNDYKQGIKNQTALLDFFSTRSLSVKRENAKEILNAMNISQKNGYETKYKMMILCKALSTSDDYWITNNKTEQWKDVNVRKNPLHNTIAQIALSGKNLTITGRIRTPELTGQGAYAKAWFRDDDNLYLYKANTKNGHEAEIEVSVSNILDCTNVPHVKYELEKKENRITSKCKNICTDQLSIVDADDVYNWCSRTGLSFNNFAEKINSNLYYQTIVVDYLISNSDRHGGNWGFYVNNKTGNIIDIHPLYDHNNAFNEQLMEDEFGGNSLMIRNKTQKEAAQYAIKKCEFSFTKEITEEMFFSEKMYVSFCNRAVELGLMEEIEPTLLQKLKIKPYAQYKTIVNEEISDINYYENLEKNLANDTYKWQKENQYSKSEADIMEEIVTQNDINLSTCYKKDDRAERKTLSQHSDNFGDERLYSEETPYEKEIEQKYEEIWDIEDR